MIEDRQYIVVHDNTIIDKFDALDAVHAVQQLRAVYKNDAFYTLYVEVGPKAYEQAKKLQADDTNADTTSREAE